MRLWYRFLQVSLACSLVVGYPLIFGLCAGMFVGLIIRVSPGEYIQNLVRFDYQIFFNVLLPPIILNSGYELHQVGLLKASPPNFWVLIRASN
jgi:NhaP-type Na+/H+ or K+/H+ antiporter